MAFLFSETYSENFNPFTSEPIICSQCHYWKDPTKLEMHLEIKSLSEGVNEISVTNKVSSQEGKIKLPDTN